MRGGVAGSGGMLAAAGKVVYKHAGLDFTGVPDEVRVLSMCH